MEITVTGANALTYPSLHIWNWMVSLYLFLVGVASGLLVMSAAASLRGKSPGCLEREDSIRAAMMVPFLLVLGMFFMWLDLEQKHHSFWLFFSFSLTSPMSWGGWGLALMVPVSLLYGLSVVQDEYRHWLRFGFLKNLSRRLNPSMPMLAKICLGLGIFLGIYTGISLSVFVARPLWNSPLLPVLFLSSALSNGAALIIIIARTKSARLFFTKAQIWLILAQVIIAALFFLGHLTSTAPQRESVMPFLSYAHDYFFFGISFVFLTLLVPFALVLKVLGLKADHREQISKAVLLRMKLSAYLVLAGGLIMRFACVYLGQLSKLS
jgi:protein NrfD